MQIKENLKEPVVIKFYVFLILQGFVMPSFHDFDYFFYLDVPKLSKSTISFAQIFGGLFIGLVPFIYQRFLRDAEYTTCFYVSQASYIIQGMISISLALRLNLLVGIPDILMFIVSGPAAAVIERGLTMLPSQIILAKVILPGVEASMISFSATIISLNQFSIRNIMGVVINDKFFQVSNESFDQYYMLQVAALIGYVVPLLFIHLMVPSLKEINEIQERNTKIQTFNKATSEEFDV